ncbi:MAG TPA: hypothetical protein VFM53_13890 [Anaeromyxobacteraceae bacterium]|nr:hypothetical protein [Anaeromyxobacteraceae bacterium]
MRRATIAALGGAVLGLAACGGSSGTTTGGGGNSCTPGTTATINVAAAGVAPKAVCVLPGGTVRFNNGDTVAHDIESDGSCAELNLGSIAPGSFKSATFPNLGSCAFHDAAAPANTAFQGTVAVTEATTTGPGY